MRLLLFLILGTLIFGVAFPAFILIAALILFIIAAVAIIGLFTGIFGGKKNVIIFKNGRRVDNFGKRNSARHPADDPEVMTGYGYSENSDTDDFGEHAASEIVELPASALSKDDEKTGAPNK